ncbi:MAG TPA: alpha/beta fold hydrolase [Acidimicrobiia bacterium]
MTLPISRRGLGIGLAAGVPLVASALIELARRPLLRVTVAGPELCGRRTVIKSPDVGPVHVRHIPGEEGWSLVLVHGWSGCADVTWHAVAPQLAGGPNVWIIDLPGHGRAPLEGRFDLEDAARRIALIVDLAKREGPVTLVGYSMGGAASLTGFHLGILDNVDRYFAVATADRFATPSLSVKLWAARIIGAGDRSPFILRQAWKRGKVSKREMVAWILQNRPPSKVLAETAAVLSRFDLSGALVDLPVDSEWIIADADSVIPVDEQVSSAQRHGVPVLRLNASHAVAMEHPIDLARILRTQRKPSGPSRALSEALPGEYV